MSGTDIAYLSGSFSSPLALRSYVVQVPKKHTDAAPPTRICYARSTPYPAYCTGLATSGPDSAWYGLRVLGTNMLYGAV
eukprot:2025800-Rhodomonas_salina.5